MPDQKMAYGGGAAESVMHPLVAVAMIIGVVSMLLLPRKYAAVPFLLVGFITPFGEQLYVGGVHIFVLRMLILFSWVRIVWTKISSKTEIVSGGFNPVDKAFALWGVFRALALILICRGDWGAIVYQVGFLWDVLGGYFLLRFLIRDKEDVARVIEAFAIVVAILALTMTNEKLRDQNIFGFLGGVPISPDIREGAIRAQGTFATSILAGSFAATLLPLFLWLWQSRRSKIAAIAGVVGSSVMVLTSASSTPLLAVLAVFVGLCFWPVRRKMRIIRWGIVIVLLACHLAMKAPVWFLIAHVDLVAGNSGYHRAMLIDTCIRHFWDWWLIGTNDAINWGVDMWDLSNQFVAEAETGGLVTFVCFILMISWSFGRIGRARKLVAGNRNKEWFLWFLGVALFSHCVAYFGISYFDQTKFAWFALLATISAATGPILAAKATQRPYLNMALPDAGTKFLTPCPVGDGQAELTLTPTSKSWLTDKTVHTSRGEV